MRRSAIALFVGFFLLLAARVPSVGAQTLFLDYVGFDYENPNPDGSQFGEAGSGYVGLGFMPGLFAPLVADSATNQYTYHIHGLTSLGPVAVGPFIIVNYTAGVLDVYEDSKLSGTNADYGVNPPNGTAPFTFTDGALFVSGALTNFQVIINVTDGSGSYEGNYEVTGGAQLSNVPVNQRKGWTFSGVTRNALNIPLGYAHQVDGQVFLNQPVSVRGASWGQIKEKYRR